jgi:AraC-like DNA-binding protein
LQQVLTEILIAEDNDTLSRHDLAWSQKACDLIGATALEQIPMPKIARDMGMTYESFRKRFTRLAGMSPTHYRNKRIVDRVCRLLQETNLSVKEIAYRLGFCDEFHFSHRFKKITGRSPSEYRRTLPTRTSPRTTG